MENTDVGPFVISLVLTRLPLFFFSFFIPIIAFLVVVW